RTAAYALGATGAVALGVGAVFGVLAAGDKSDAESDETLCGADKRCTPAGEELIDRARGRATIATIGIGVGALALGTGVVLYFLSSEPDKSSSSTLVPYASPMGG